MDAAYAVDGLRRPGPGMRMPNALGLTVHDDSERLALAAARRIAELAARAVAQHGVFRMALAGGETPRRCYEHLREIPLDWARIQVYFGDERCLPAGDAGRNDSMARRALLDHVAVPQANVHAILAERGARIAALEYAELLERLPRFDLVLLGMGEDGHTASLFPGNPALELDDIVVPVFNAPKPPPERVSLSLATLGAAHGKMFLVAGEAKREALEQILFGAELPAARVPGAEWHVDRAALPQPAV